MSKEIDDSEQGHPKEVQQRPTSGDDESDEKLPKDDGDQCGTPTSSEHKIPTVRSCPPTPRKQARPVLPHKRKLHFFEITGREEVESFFRSNDRSTSPSSSRSSKRRCTSI
ncbi:hypothetical protein ACJRO7_013103 [Eucalyptus globulus]|uniref:Uncharacterized protein n=1 Tax=Eucalyptus globulus TaxID=34317 RepID=A0ABD3LKS9_EUCGL